MRSTQQQKNNNSYPAYQYEPEIADTAESADERTAYAPPDPSRGGIPKPPKLPKPPKPPKAPKERSGKAFRLSFGDVMRSRAVIGGFCVVIALIIAFVAVPYIQSMVSRRVPVLVAAAELPKGTLIRAEHLSSGEIGAIDRPADAAVSADQVAGTYARYDILPGDIIVSGKLSSDFPLSNPYLYNLPPDKSALSVSVQGLAEGLTGKLKPGDIVSVYAVLSGVNDDEETYSAIQPPELKFVRVLAVSNSEGRDIDVDEMIVSEDAGENLPATVTLLAGDFQAAALAGLDRKSAIYFALVARADDESRCSGLLAAQEESIAELIKELEEKEKESEDTESGGEEITAGNVSAQNGGGISNDTEENEVSGPDSQARGNG